METVTKTYLSTIIFLFTTIIGFSQNENLSNNDNYSDICDVSKSIINNHLITWNKFSKKTRDKIFYLVVSNKDFVHDIHSNKNKYLKENEMSFLFSNKELKNYNNQIYKNPIINSCDFESDNLFIYNKKRDAVTFFNNKLKGVAMFEERIDKVCVPIFSIDKNYCLIKVISPGGSYVSIYKKTINNWRFYKQIHESIY